MSSIKSLLKQAKEAIGAEDFDTAIELIEEIHDLDPRNYHSFVFLGLAYSKKSDVGESEKAYQAAIDLDPSIPLAYQGLCNLYESNDEAEKLMNAYDNLINVYIQMGDATKSFETWSKLLELVEKEKPHSLQQIEVLRKALPGTDLYSSLSSNTSISLPSSLETLEKIASIREDYDAKWIERESQARRGRLGSDPYPILRKKVEAEALLSSDLEGTYDQILQNLTEDDAKYRRYSLKLLEFMYRKLYFVDDAAKSDLLKNVLHRAEQLQSLNIVESSLTSQILIELQDIPLTEINGQIFQGVACSQTIEPYGSVVGAWKKWTEGTSALDFLAILDAFTSSVKESRLFLLLKCEALSKARKFDEAVNCVQFLQSFLSDLSSQTGASYPMTNLALDLLHGTCLLELGPKLLPSALTQFKKVLSQNSQCIEGLFGLGRVLLGLGKYEESKKAFAKVLTLDPNHILARSELSWAFFKCGQIQESLDMLLKLEAETGGHYLLKYRIARIYWEMGEQYQTDKSYVFTQLIEAARLNPQFAPTFALLGQFYYTIEKDEPRAVKCFVKALSIDPSEETAVDLLSSIWLQLNLIDEAVNLLKQFTDYVPRSAWAWNRLGIQSLIKRQGQDAISQFQASLRIESDDVTVWTSLGEAYTLEGRHMAAIKALDRALELDPTFLHARYVKATVEHSVGLLDESLESYLVVLEALSQNDEASLAKLPILKGMAECSLDAAADQYQKGGYGSCATHLSRVVYFSHLGLKLSPDQVPFLTLIGDACLAFITSTPHLSSRTLPDGQTFSDHVRTMSTSLNFNLQDTSESLLILENAVAAYQNAIDVVTKDPESMFAPFLPDYYERHGTALFYLHKCHLNHTNQETATITSWLAGSIKAFKLALSIRPLSSSTWNALGICLSDLNPKIAQGGFIRSIEINPQAATPWINLGIFYFKNKDLELAKLAFSKAQVLDPDSSLGWFGQGLVEQALGNRGLSSTVFAHAFEIGQASETEVLYHFAEACYNNRDNKAAVGNTSPLSTAAYCLLKCVERGLNDPAVYNLYGLVLERQGMFDLSADAFSKAATLLEPFGNNILSVAAVMENMGRVLCSAKRFEEARQVFNNLIVLAESSHSGADETTVIHLDSYPYVGLGLCHFFMGELSESLIAFEKALAVCESLQTSETQEQSSRLARLKNDTKLLLSQVLFALGSESHILLAREQLLECFQTDSTYIKAILTLAVMGLVYSDIQLAQTAAAELIQLDADQRGTLDEEIDHVLSAMFMIQGRGNWNVARRFLLKAVHRYPWKASRWSRYAGWAQKVHATAYAHSALKSAEAARVLTPSLMTADDRALIKNVDEANEVAELHRTVGLSTLSGGGDTRSAKLAFYRAIVSKPSSLRNWVGLGLYQTTRSIEKSWRSHDQNYLGPLVSVSAVISTLGSKEETPAKQLAGIIWASIFHLEEAIQTTEKSPSTPHPDHVAVHGHVEQLLHQHQESLYDTTKQIILLSLARSSFAHSRLIKDALPYLEQAILLGVGNPGQSEGTHWTIPVDILASMAEDSTRSRLQDWVLSQLSSIQRELTGRVSPERMCVLLKQARLSLLLGDTTSSMNAIQEVLQQNGDVDLASHSSSSNNVSIARLLQLAIMIRTGSSNTSKLDKLAEGLTDVFPEAVEYLKSNKVIET